MTRLDMETALVTGFNKQGRHLSESMRVKYLTALAAPPKPKMAREEYRGFKIEGSSGKWFVESFPVVFTSHKSALAQVDRCLELRALLAD